MTCIRRDMKVFEALRALGVSKAEFSRHVGGIGPHTLKRVDDGISTVKPQTIARVRKALLELKAEREKQLQRVLSA